MAAKRALVVDDSKSARAFLSRILERHALEVDSAESAEEAIDYLTRHRPDVIFMDHLMPGMDGFQAVQAIKNNPRTATIPILMYTSQEGELYLGQARALGAIGVLPKQIRPTDVTQVLHQLHLVEDRRVTQAAWAIAAPTDPTVVAPVMNAGAPPADAATTATVPQLPSTGDTSLTGRFALGGSSEILLRDQIAELRRTLTARLDGQQDTLRELVREAVRVELPPPQATVTPAALPPAPPRSRPAFAVAFALLTLAFGLLWWNEATRRTQIEQRLAALAEKTADTAAPAPSANGSSIVESQRAETPEAGQSPSRSPTSPVTFAVPYGEAPLAGERVAGIRAVLEDLRHAGFHGDVEVQVSQGRFCLAGSNAEGWTLPAEELPQARCDRIGNPIQDGGASRESLPFANMLGEQRRAARDAFGIRVSEQQDRLAQPYPETAPTTTAGQWNAAAAANNRVELRWRERP